MALAIPFTGSASVLHRPSALSISLLPRTRQTFEGIIPYAFESPIMEVVKMRHLWTSAEADLIPSSLDDFTTYTRTFLCGQNRPHWHLRIY